MRSGEGGNGRGEDEGGEETETPALREGLSRRVESSNDVTPTQGGNEFVHSSNPPYDVDSSTCFGISHGKVDEFAEHGRDAVLCLSRARCRVGEVASRALKGRSDEVGGAECGDGREAMEEGDGGRRLVRREDHVGQGMRESLRTDFDAESTSYGGEDERSSLVFVQDRHRVSSTLLSLNGQVGEVDGEELGDVQGRELGDVLGRGGGGTELVEGGGEDVPSEARCVRAELLLEAGGGRGGRGEVGRKGR